MKSVHLGKSKMSLQYIDSSKAGLDSVLEGYLRDSLEVFEAFLGKSTAGGLGLFKEGVVGIEVSLTLCGQQKIRSLNSEYRGKDSVTDVLSFPVHDDLRPESRIPLFSEGVLELGDIFICRDVAEKQASSFGVTYHQEILHLLVHGLLHLCGFDHEVSEEEEKIMTSFEDRLVKDLYKKLGFENG